MDINYTQKIRQTIEELPGGGIITTDQFSSKWPRDTVLRILSRLCKEGVLERVKRGVYSKLKKTRFGNLVSAPLEVLAREVHEDENKCFGGIFLFNNLGLTTQVPTVIEVLNNKSSYKVKINSTLVRYVKIRPKITKENKKFIMFLEVLKNSKSIPDGDAKNTHQWLNKKLDEYTDKELKQLIALTLEYPPRVRALLGSLLSVKGDRYTASIKDTLKPHIGYKVGRIVELLNQPDFWRLKV